MFFERTKCRACDSGAKELSRCKESAPETTLIPVFDLGLQPLANDFKYQDEEKAGYAPLKVMYCPRCTLSQLSVVVKPEILYSNYPYVTSKSKTMEAHFELLWQTINIACKPEVVAEIGSNDGDFLKFCKQNGAERVIGIDPAKNLVDIAIQSGIPMLCDTLNIDSASVAASSVPPIDAIVARHVFCHIDEWWVFIRCLDKMAHRNTAIFIEVPYVVDMLDHLEFDTIYHEHLSYLSIRAMLALLDNTPFKLENITRFPIHGGAIVMLIRRRDSGLSVDASVAEFVELEQNMETRWETFRNGCKRKIDDLKQTVHDLVACEKSVAGFGASAKSTVWINACGFSREQVRFICDCTPQKQGRFSPGSDIPIVEESSLLLDKPDYAILWSWNFRKEILEKQTEYRNRGGKFIVPVPKLEFV